MSTLLKFKDRSRTDYINRKIIEVFRQCEGPDVDLIVANKKVVSAHRVILTMYSNYFRRLLAHSGPERKFIVPMTSFTSIVMQTVVHFFYYGEVQVLGSIKGQVLKALEFLEVQYEQPGKKQAAMKRPFPIEQPSDTAKTNSPQTIDPITVSPQIQNKSGAEQQQPLKQNDLIKQKIDPTDQCAAPTLVKPTVVSTTVENSIVSNENVPSTKLSVPIVATAEKNTPPIQQNDEQAIKSVDTSPQTENVQVKSTISNESTTEDAAEKIEKQSISTATLFAYDVDKAAEELHETVDALIKELDNEIDDIEYDSYDDELEL
ncbi:modifier of mdg4-like isoform X2 [Contarinia nasturtii]|uniref:modifier of mdg4-like isoform X2 n=1 Tax=Contarinia nasturtii TaxID=265458 RepID=UPI0012D4BC92|nr:modifier of mdg4-like isoform X2 [Contarinia nasturtii]